MRKALLFASLLAVLLVSAILLASPKPKLAVMEIDSDCPELSKSDVKKATRYLRTSIEVAGVYVVIDKGRQDKALTKQMQQESYGACVDESCQIELGRSLAADTILRSKITEFAGECTLTATLVNLEQQAAVGGAKADFDCSVKGLRVAIDKVVERLTGKAAAPAPSPTPTPQADGDMVFVPAGEFWMGCNESVDSECDSKEKPYRKVYVDAFKIDKTEVTVAQFSECVKAGRCSSDGLTMPYWNGSNQPDWAWACNWGKGRDDHPINTVDWYQAKMYCEWAGKRLPTEAEWEKAARGTDGRKYSWGNAGYGASGPVANIGDETVLQKYPNSSYAKGYTDGYVGTSPVGSFPKGASPYGALDMIGNVWEWCSDWYDSDYYQNGPTRNPTGPSSGQYRVLRGGSWNNLQKGARVSAHEGDDPARRFVNYGFRCAQ